MELHRLLKLTVCLAVVALLAGGDVTPVPASPAENVLVIAQGTEPDILDAQKINVTEMENIARAINEGLLRYNYTSKKLEPLLAESWSVLSDGVTWQFKIRRNVRFTNEEELTAETVKYSYERFVDRNRVRLLSDGARLAPFVARVEVVDKYTFNFVTKAPTPLFDYRLLRFAIVPPGYVESVGDEKFVISPLGTGPFRFVEWVRGERIVLTANRSYWRGRPKVDRVVFRFMPEASSRTSALRAGEAHIATLVPFPDVAVLRRESNLKVVSSLIDRSLFVMFNHESPELQDKRVREALNLAVDKELIISEVVGGFGRALKGQLITPDWTGYDPSILAYRYDPKKAREMLQATGFNFNATLEFITPVARWMQDKEIAEAVAGQLAQVGVKTTITPMETGLWLRRVFIDRAMKHFSLVGLNVPFPDASAMLENQLSESPNSYYRNAEYDRTVRLLRTTVDPAKRRELIRQAIAIMRDDPPAIFLHQLSNIYGVSIRVQGFQAFPNELIDLFPISLR